MANILLSKHRARNAWWHAVLWVLLLFLSLTDRVKTWQKLITSLLVTSFKSLLSSSGQRLFETARQSKDWCDWDKFHHWFAERLVWFCWLWILLCTIPFSSLPLDLNVIEPEMIFPLLATWFVLVLLGGLTLVLAVGLLGYRWAGVMFFGLPIWLGSTGGLIIQGVDWRYLGFPLSLVGFGITILGLSGWSFLDKWRALDRWWNDAASNGQKEAGYEH